jgi:hypothetical protein
VIVFVPVGGLGQILVGLIVPPSAPFFFFFLCCCFTYLKKGFERALSPEPLSASHVTTVN